MRGKLLMYRLSLSFAVVAMLLFPIAESGGAQSREFVVLLDAAHGGEDSGVVSDSFKEKELTLKLALLIREEARKAPGLKVILTRSLDRKMSKAERIRAIGTAKADCLLSLHVNAGFGNKANGYEIYFPGFNNNQAENGDSKTIIKDMTKNKSLNDSVLFSQDMKGALEAVFPRKGRGLREAPSPLLTGLDIPALTLEIGFATNPDDRKLVADEDTQAAASRAIVNGLREYSRKAEGKGF
ncbi:MAG: N-acetylmuramoyl-L-alanine amidase family protein [Syntrophales bacterium]